MLRVSDEWERALHAPAMAVAQPGDVIVIRSGRSSEGRQGVSLATGVSNRSAGARALCLHLVTIPPRTRGVPHRHEGHESAIYSVSGETEVCTARACGSAPCSGPATSCTCHRASRTSR
jgi:uncharacterized RmlC-like cupin family protein